MWHLLRSLQNMRKSSKVADETMIERGGGNLQVELPIFGGDGGRTRQERSGTFSFIYGVLYAPISILSCISHPHVHGSSADHMVWDSDDFGHYTSEINHLVER